MDIILIIGLIGSIASIISIPIAIVQTIRSRQLKKEQEMMIWQRMETVKSIIRALATEDTEFAKGLIQELYRNLLRDAILLEPSFDVNTLNKWRDTGKISSSWQERNALMLMRTTGVTTNFKSKYTHFDEEVINSGNKIEFDKTKISEDVPKIEFTNETPTNFETKGHICFIVDSSLSNQKLKLINSKLDELREDILSNPTQQMRAEISIISPNSKKEILLEPTILSKNKFPLITTSKEKFDIDKGMTTALRLIAERKEWYKETGQPYFKPMIIVLNEDLNQREIENLIGLNRNFKYNQGYVNLIACDISEFSNKRLIQLFEWLSGYSINVITSSISGEKVDLPDATDWMTGFTI